MAAWTDLTPEEQAAVKNLEDNFARPLAAKFKHDKDMFDPIMADWFANVAGIVSNLNANEVIPLTSTLAGAQTPTKEQLQTLMGWIDQRNNDDFDQQLAVRAAGVNANVNEA